MMSLVDGGVYAVRPTASCALVRALCDDSASETFNSHPFIEHMKAAKKDLYEKGRVRLTPGIYKTKCASVSVV